MCNGVLCHWSATVVVQKYRRTLRSSQDTMEKRTGSRASQDCAGSLENGRDAGRARAATVKAELQQCCTYQAYPAENFLAINKKLIEVHFVLWQNSRIAVKNRWKWRIVIKTEKKLGQAIGHNS